MPDSVGARPTLWDRLRRGLAGLVAPPSPAVPRRPRDAREDAPTSATPSPSPGPAHRPPACAACPMSLAVNQYWADYYCKFLKQTVDEPACTDEQWATLTRDAIARIAGSGGRFP